MLIITFCFLGRENGDDDVSIKVLYCGVCHSDLHMLKNDWGSTDYPVVPGYDRTQNKKTKVLMISYICVYIEFQNKVCSLVELKGIKGCHL